MVLPPMSRMLTVIAAMITASTAAKIITLAICMLPVEPQEHAADEHAEGAQATHRPIDLVGGRMLGQHHDTTHSAQSDTEREHRDHLDDFPLPIHQNLFFLPPIGEDTGFAGDAFTEGLAAGLGVVLTGFG